ncbi:patatin-like phospholipase family protein [Pedobacter sp. UBA5917]|uniref:patatin-like phospholipase family protein n=1 Tax=Pedobacter sp. UBA5917 TaxID=1947061 RepID=UPI0025D66C85|nr:patatin-like phospholipase family protein [Pedobacter sp. UBA5917]
MGEDPIYPKIVNNEHLTDYINTPLLNFKPPKTTIINEIKVPENPLNHIALSLSGGGYLAASFHLESMFYLNKVTLKNKPLLENVKMISTVSGGTITGVVYALMMQQKKDFDTFYKFLLDNLQNLDLIKTF